MSIDLSITMADNPADIKVSARGTTIRPATDADMRRFGLQRLHHTGGPGVNWPVWNAVWRKFSHCYPTLVAFGDHPIFNEHKPTTVLSEVIGAELLSHSVKPNVYDSTRARNLNPVPTEEEVARGVTNIDIAEGSLGKTQTRSKATTEFDSLSWGLSTTVSLEVGGDAQGYKLGVSATASLGGESGESETNTNETSFNMEKGYEVQVPPQTAKRIELVAGDGDLKVRLKFQNYLDGMVGINWHKVRQPTGKAWEIVTIQDFVDELIRNGDWRGNPQSYETLGFGFVTDGTITNRPIPIWYD